MASVIYRFSHTTGPCYGPLFASLDSGGVCSMGPCLAYVVHNGYIRTPDSETICRPMALMFDPALAGLLEVRTLGAHTRGP